MLHLRRINGDQSQTANSSTLFSSSQLSELKFRVPSNILLGNIGEPLDYEQDERYPFENDEYSVLPSGSIRSCTPEIMSQIDDSDSVTLPSITSWYIQERDSEYFRTPSISFDEIIEVTESGSFFESCSDIHAQIC